METNPTSDFLESIYNHLVESPIDNKTSDEKYNELIKECDELQTKYLRLLLATHNMRQTNEDLNTELDVLTIANSLLVDANTQHLIDYNVSSEALKELKELQETLKEFQETNKNQTTTINQLQEALDIETTEQTRVIMELNAKVYAYEQTSMANLITDIKYYQDDINNLITENNNLRLTLHTANINRPYYTRYQVPPSFIPSYAAQPPMYLNAHRTYAHYAAQRRARLARLETPEYQS
jgi:hypothetical protein